MIKHIYSDFFGVLASEVAPVWLPKHMSAEEAVAYKRDVVEQVDKGVITFSQLLAYLSIKTGVPPQQIKQEWYDLSYPHSDFIAYMYALKGKYDICLLSNASSDFLRLLLDKHHLNDLFRHVFISAEVKMVKPNADFFLYAMDKMGFKPEECLFVDDNPVNCEGAKKVGMHVVRYQNAMQVRREFEALGVSLPID